MKTDWAKTKKKIDKSDDVMYSLWKMVRIEVWVETAQFLIDNLNVQVTENLAKVKASIKEKRNV